MSTIKVNNLQNPSAANPAFVLAADGSATANLSSLNGGPIAGSRNRIINGDMRIDQRNAGASVTPAADSHLIDRFTAGLTQASKMTFQQSSIAPAGFNNSLSVTVASAPTVGASDWFGFFHKIEGYNVADFGFGAAGASTVTLSFWVRSSVTGTYGGSLMNSAQNRSYPYNYTISAANTWEKKTVSIAGDTAGTWLTTNLTGFLLIWSLGAGSTFLGTANAWGTANALGTSGQINWVTNAGATFYITGVQLEPGTVATPFERRSYGAELALCQRYTHAATADGALNNFMVFGIGRWIGGSDAQIAIQHPVEMRTVPTLESNTAVGTFFVNTGGGLGGVALTGIALNEAGINVSTVSANYSTGGQTTGQATTLYCNNTSFAKLVFSAEL
jgi:hypothetical protein